MSSTPYWASPPAELVQRLGSGPDGLSADEARRRLAAHGPNELEAGHRLSRLRALGNQLRSPLLLLLGFAAAVSLVAGEWSDAAIVAVILGASVAIGYVREVRTERALAELLGRMRAEADVTRDGRLQRVPRREVVPGDVVHLSAGSLVPADGVLLEATDCFVNEAVLTGESFPVEKRPGEAAAAATIGARKGCVFFGTNVRSGTARCLVVETGGATRFGEIAHHLALRAPETEFERGLRQFGLLLLAAMTLMVLVVFAANVIFGRPPMETLLFSIALAVGLSPELLPAILSVNLARSATRLAARGILVRRLSAIENLGSMNILCTDKTGTLTEGVARLEGAYDLDGQPSARTLELAAQNAALQTGLHNPLDEAILEAHAADLRDVVKLGEIPYDFVRKQLSVIVDSGGARRLITKGAVSHVLAASTRSAGGAPLDEPRLASLNARLDGLAADGVRTLAVATRVLEPDEAWGRDAERELTFEGFLTFRDPPKASAGPVIADLARLGVAVKMISGDTGLVARHVAAAVGLRADRVLTGQELDELHDEALWHAAPRTDLFVEVDPNQKERILLALKRTGHVVGFLGDGVNDAPAMHAADVSLSVDDAVEVAKEAADFVLLERRLDVIRHGIEEGRRTFANTLKYILTTTSANLGNMVSMAVASLFLPFLPLTAGQILLNNLLSDVPAIGIAADSVDPEQVERPHRWSNRFIGRFMLEFGLLSSTFDLLTFGVLLHVFHTPAALFRTGWFVESLLTELAVALVVRTRGAIWRSRPGRLLVVLSAAVAVGAIALPFLPIAPLLGLAAPPPALVAAIAGITVLYVASAELAKRWFYRRTA